MPLIVAIEPDTRQAAQLADLVRHHVGAELVHAETTEQVLTELAKIGDRVPDLVLVPSLLSAQEDAALAGALRIIATAANVRMLTIPVLADPEQPASHRGVLARWRSRAPSRARGGCDPAVFAEQISDYLREAAAERRLAADATYDTMDDVLQDIVEDAERAAQPEEDPGPPFELQPPPAYVPAPEAELELIAESQSALEAARTFEFEAAADEPRAPQAELDLVPFVDAEPEPEAAPEPEPEPVRELTALAPVSIDEVASDQDAVDALIAPLLRDLEATRTHVADEPAPVAAVESQPPAPPVVPTAPDPDPMFFVEAPPIPRDQTAWMELIASLREDIERLKREKADPVMAVTEAAPARAIAALPVRRARRPAQDQWGLFDPDQCGFGALLSKLEEINAREDAAR